MTKPNLIKQLWLWVDKDNIIHARTHDRSVTFGYDSKFPILIPNKGVFTRLLIMDTHETYYHCGISQVVNMLRQLDTLSQRTVITKDCPIIQPPSLPTYRFETTRPFAYTSCDIGGPFYVKNPNAEGKKARKKCSNAMFYCSPAWHSEALTCSWSVLCKGSILFWLLNASLASGGVQLQSCVTIIPPITMWPRRWLHFWSLSLFASLPWNIK